MALPLYYKAGRNWPAQIYSRPLRRRGIVLGSLAIIVIGMLCTTLLVGVWTEVGETPLAKRGLEDGEGFTPKESDPERSLWHLHLINQEQPRISTAAPNIVGLESPIDLLGGLTGVMSNFYVGKTKSTPSPTAVPAVDPLTALSAAFQQAITNGELLKYDATIEKTNIESRATTRYIQDSIVWAGQPSLLSILCVIVGQVCVIDSGAGARLLDTILEILPVNSMGIASIIPGVVQYSSVSTTDILPLVLPAIATALGQQLQPPQIADIGNIDGIMANIIWHGGIFVSEIISSKIYLANTELYDVLNQVAGLMCAAADHLTLPICTISKQFSGITYEIVIPCGCTSSRLPSVTSQPPPGYMPEETSVTSATDWTVMTMSPTAGYSFPSLSSSILPPKYQKCTSDFTTDVPLANIPTQSNRPYGQPLQSSCTSTLPPASSTQSGEIPPALLTSIAHKPLVPISANEYTESDSAAPTAACPICSCASEAPPAYSSPPVENGATEIPQEVPQSYGYEEQESTSTALLTTESATEPSRQPIEPTTANDAIPKYSKQKEEPSQSPDSYNKSRYVTGTSSYYSSPKDWTYLGCFSDTLERVVQGGGPGGSFRGDVSNGKCMEFCKWNGFSTAGTEDGTECWCGNSIADNIQLLPATACSTACQGDGSEYCGGTWAISIYTSQKKNQEKQPKYKTLSELLALK